MAAVPHCLKQPAPLCVQVALNLVPSKDAFLQCIAPSAQQTELLQRAVVAFQPVLQNVHAFLDREGLDDPTPV